MYAVYGSMLACLFASVVALKKGAAPFCLYMLFFILLVPVQAVFINSDLQNDRYTVYLRSVITRDGFSGAILYLAATSALLLLFSLGAKPISAKGVARYQYYFNPGPSFYFSVLTYLSMVSAVLVFFIVGLDKFFEASRPGLESGSSIFLVALSVGVFPILIKYLLNGTANKYDILCFFVVICVTITLSRIHVIFYSCALFFSIYYGRSFHLKRVKISSLLRVVCWGAAGLTGFIGVGAARDALNYTNFANLFEFLLENPELSLLSVQQNYRVSVEGMAGLAGAFSSAYSDSSSVVYDGGASWLVRGMLQAVPGFIKEYLGDIYEAIHKLEWYTLTIVPSGIETSYTSYGYLGPLVYTSLFYFLSWRLVRRLANPNRHPLIRLSCLIVIANGIFFVRGSWYHWIGFSIAYILVIYLSWRLFSVNIGRLSTTVARYQ